MILKTEKIHKYQRNNNVVLISCWYTPKILFSSLRVLASYSVCFFICNDFSIERKDRKILCAEGSFRFGEVCVRMNAFPSQGTRLSNRTTSHMLASTSVHSLTFFQC